MNYKGIFNTKYPREIAKRLGDTAASIISKTYTGEPGWFWVEIQDKYILTWKY